LFFVLGGLGVGGVHVYRGLTAKDRVIEEQQRVIAGLEENLDRVWADELVADVRVDRLTENTDTGEQAMHLTFIQYAPDTETALFERPLVLPGREFYIDALVVKFARGFVENGDGMRGKSLLLFRRAFGDEQKPVDGIPLYAAGEQPVPELVKVDETPSAFERDIWNRFWELANDLDGARDLGISVVQGEAPHLRPAVGQVYKLTLRASGGLDIVPRLPAAALPKAPHASR